MVWLPIVWLLVAHEPHIAAGDPDHCRCAAALAADGRCQKCRVGYFASVRIESEKLYEVLDPHGHQVSAALTRCAACRELISRGGYCTACNMGYVNGRGYFGRVSYHVARGRVIDPASVRRPCPKADGGWCAICRLGIVGNRAFGDQADLEQARRYLAVLESAVAKAAQCEDCAMALIADSRCHRCAIEYREGKPVGTSAGPTKNSG